jgi:hypothetical protein
VDTRGPKERIQEEQNLKCAPFNLHFSMPRQYSSTKFKIFALILISVQLWVTGCGPRMLPPTSDPIRFTDKQVVEFNNRLTVMMQNNRNWNSIMRYVSTIVVVGAVASAGALGIAGVSADIVGYTALGGGFIGEMQGIFKTRERASAYQEGIGLLYEASIRYKKSTVGNHAGSGVARNDRLTNNGAYLYEESLASLKLVEIALVSQIPTVEEVQKANGKYQKFDVFPSKVKFSDTSSPLEVRAIKGGPIVSAISANSAVISTEMKEGVALLTLNDKDKLKETIEVLLMNAQGIQAKVEVIATADAVETVEAETGDVDESMRFDNDLLNNRKSRTLSPNPVAPVKDNNSLKKKAVSEDAVRGIQAHLKIPLTGKFDIATQKRVLEFQKENNLKPANGFVNQETFNSILRISSNPN